MKHLESNNLLCGILVNPMQLQLLTTIDDFGEIMNSTL